MSYALTIMHLDTSKDFLKSFDHLIICYPHTTVVTLEEFLNLFSFIQYRFFDTIRVNNGKSCEHTTWVNINKWEKLSKSWSEYFYTRIELASPVFFCRINKIRIVDRVVCTIILILQRWMRLIWMKLSYIWVEYFVSNTDYIGKSNNIWTLPILIDYIIMFKESSFRLKLTYNWMLFENSIDPSADDMAITSRILSRIHSAILGKRGVLIFIAPMKDILRKTRIYESAYRFNRCLNKLLFTFWEQYIFIECSLIRRYTSIEGFHLL